MEINTQTITVAIADADRDRRLNYERQLHGANNITLLGNGASSIEVSNDHAFEGRWLNPSKKVSAYENEVARIKGLMPLVLVINLNQCTDEDYAFLLSLRHECPDAIMLLLFEDSIQESQILQVMEIGARGFLKHKAVQQYLLMAIQVVGRGEAWVPRRMLANIMEHMLNQ